MFEVDHTLNPENLKKSTQRAEPVTTDDILEACGVVPQSREAIMDAVAKATGRGERAVWYAFQSAISQNLLRVETTPRPNARPMLRYSKP